MKTSNIKLLVLETHQRKLKNGNWSTSGVDYARVILPATHLKKIEGFEVDIRKEPFTKDEPTWQEITANHDIIWTSYIDEPIGYVQMAFWAEKNGCKVVIDLDDNIWELSKDNPVYEAYHPGSEKLHILSNILEHVDYITTTTQHLKRKICEMTRKDPKLVIVLPNYIDLEQYDVSKVKRVRKDKITITHAGSSTHFKDLLSHGFVQAMTKILKEFPHVELVTVGNWIPQFTSLFGSQYRHMIGKPDIYEYMSELYPQLIGQTDIAVAPLFYDKATRCKSGIKYLEFSAGKVPGVYQKMDQYGDYLRWNPSRGLLAETSDDWYQALKKLITDKTLRENMGQDAYAFVKQHHTIQGNIERHVKFFESI